MNALLDRPLLPELFSYNTLNRTISKNVLTKRGNTSPSEVPSRCEIVADALRAGVSLQAVEDYFDWLDMCSSPK